MLFLCEDQHTVKFSYLRQCIFNISFLLQIQGKVDEIKTLVVLSSCVTCLTQFNYCSLTQSFKSCFSVAHVYLLNFLQFCASANFFSLPFSPLFRIPYIFRLLPLFLLPLFYYFNVQNKDNFKHLALQDVYQKLLYLQRDYCNILFLAILLTDPTTLLIMMNQL